MEKERAADSMQFGKFNGTERSGEREIRRKYAVWYGLLRCSMCERKKEPLKVSSWVWPTLS